MFFYTGVCRESELLIRASGLAGVHSRSHDVMGILTDPRLQGLPIGSPEWFAAQRALILAKPLVKSCYELWYRKLLEDADSVPAPHHRHAIVELGSGSSFVKQLFPEVITSDLVPGGVDLVFDGRSLPFRDASVRALLLTHVFHHIPDIHAFLRESCRVLCPGGVVSMIEVTRTPFVRFVFSKLHPEPFDDQAKTWDFPEGDSMLDSNQALSWVVLFRDRTAFLRAFPALSVEEHSYLPWLGYLLSGGVNLRGLAPRWVTPAVKAMDRVLKPLDSVFAVHWHIRLRKATGQKVCR